MTSLFTASTLVLNNENYSSIGEAKTRMLERQTLIITAKCPAKNVGILKLNKILINDSSSPPVCFMDVLCKVRPRQIKWFSSKIQILRSRGRTIMNFTSIKYRTLSTDLHRFLLDIFKFFWISLKRWHQEIDMALQAHSEYGRILVIPWLLDTSFL